MALAVETTWPASAQEGIEEAHLRFPLENPRSRVVRLTTKILIKACALRLGATSARESQAAEHVGVTNG